MEILLAKSNPPMLRGGKFPPENVIYLFINAYILTYKHTYINTDIHTYMHTPTHTYIHTIYTYIQYIHTFIHTIIPSNRDLNLNL